MKWPYPKETHVLRTVIHDEQAMAYEWIAAYAYQLSSDLEPEELIEYAVNFINVQKDGRGYPKYLCKGGDLEGELVDSLFWEKLSIFLNEKIDEENRGSFFTCSC